MKTSSAFLSALALFGAVAADKSHTKVHAKGDDGSGDNQEPSAPVSPYSPYGAYPFHPAFGGAYGAYGAYPYHPAFAGGYPFGPNPFSPFPHNNPFHPAYGHPAFNPYHPLNNPLHPANYGGFAEEKASIKAKNEPETQAQNPWAAQFAASADQWKQYYAQPISQTQWPGATARPGVHPTLGGTLNPYSPMGTPNHPYPFPMHQGLKNGPHHPRPFTALGQYYPGTSGAPFLPGMVPGAGMYPTYFPGSKHGQMTAANAALQTSAKKN